MLCLCEGYYRRREGTGPLSLDHQRQALARPLLTPHLRTAQEGSAPAPGAGQGRGPRGQARVPSHPAARCPHGYKCVRIFHAAFVGTCWSRGVPAALRRQTRLPVYLSPVPPGRGSGQADRRGQRQAATSSQACSLILSGFLSMMASPLSAATDEVLELTPGTILALALPFLGARDALALAASCRETAALLREEWVWKVQAFFILIFSSHKRKCASTCNASASVHCC